MPWIDFKPTKKFKSQKFSKTYKQKNLSKQGKQKLLQLNRAKYKKLIVGRPNLNCILAF